jgi:hypothetical protein
VVTKKTKNRLFSREKILILIWKGKKESANQRRISTFPANQRAALGAARDKNLKCLKFPEFLAQIGPRGIGGTKCLCLNV